jgi:hypothetical protein
MGAARIDSDGTVYPLDRPISPDEVVTAKDVQEPSKLASMLLRLLRDVASLKRLWTPKRIDFEDVACSLGGTNRLNHGFGGRVRWWVVEWLPASPGTAFGLEQTAATDASTLVLASSTTGTATIRVELAG